MSWPAPINDHETGEIILTLVRLSHADWVDDLRYVSDTADLTHGGEVFTAATFEIAQPDDIEAQPAAMQFRALDFDNTLYALIRETGEFIGAEVSWVLASDPDTVHVGPFDAEIRAVDHEFGVLSGALTVYPVMEERACAALRFEMIGFPGLR